MSKGFTDEDWKSIVALAHRALDVPKPERRGFVESSSTDPTIIQEVLQLAEEMELSEDDEPTLKGTPIGRFILDDYLGAGGAGEVYSAHDPELQRDVAIKILHRASQDIRDIEERFIREARAASALNHPNIVTVYEIIRTDSMLAIVMELVRGEPLRNFCGHPCSVVQLISVGKQVSGALAAAHAAGVIHRDIKPENVMMLPGDDIKVLDFGLARFGPSGEDITSNQNTGLPPGTLQYMSPEHVQGRPITAQSDIFAMGSVLYELATGHHPFAGDSPFETLQNIAIVKEKPPRELNPLIPSKIETLILSMLEKDATKRPNASEVVRALRTAEALSDAPTFLSVGRLNWVIAIIALLAVLGLGAWKFFPSPGKLPTLQPLTTFVPENRPTAHAISRDGRYLAYANSDGVFVRALRSGETELLNGPADFLVDHIAWMPDTTRLVVSGFAVDTNEPSIWITSLSARASHQLRRNARHGEPSPNGREIAFLSQSYDAILTIAVGSDDPRVAVKGPSTDTFYNPLWSADGKHLFYERRHYASNHDQGFLSEDHYYQRRFESANATTGAVVASEPDLWVDSVSMTADGRIFLLRHQAPNAVTEGRLWVLRTESGTGRFLGRAQRIRTQLDGFDRAAVQVSTTSDASRTTLLMLASQESIFVADFQRTGLRITNSRRLTLDAKANYPHAWSADGKSVIFESDRNGSYDIYRQALSERLPVPIVAAPKRWEVFPQLSPDRKDLLYAIGPGNGMPKPYTLMRVPPNGGVPHQVPVGGELEEFRCSISANGRCVVRKTIGREQFVYYHLDPIAGIGRELVRTNWQPAYTLDWDISPNGHWLALPNHDTQSARIRVLSLEEGSSSPREREVELKGVTNIAGLIWVADQTGWFVSIYTTLGRRMLFADLDGSIHGLAEIQGWMVPTADNKRVAYLDSILDTNVYELALNQP